MKPTLDVHGMTCARCAETVEKALRCVPGVEIAEVDQPRGRGTVVTAHGVDPDQLTRSVERAGYRAEISGSNAAHEEPAEERASVPPDADEDPCDYDLLIVGSGGAGMAAAIRASELGATAAIVEGGEVVGGTCVNVGCIPSKYLIEAAHRYHTARRGFPGISPSEPDLNWTEILRQKEAIVEDLRREKYLDVLHAYKGVSLLRGRAELLGRGRVRVGERVVRASKIVLATGTRPAMPPIPGLEEAGALDSTTVMELDRLPGSMIVIGGGAIGLELGQAFHRFGVRVTVLEAMDRLLPTEDPDASETLQRALEAEGMEIRTGVKVTRVACGDHGCTVFAESGLEFVAERLLVATGRRPNTEGLGLETAGVRTTERGFIETDALMRTSVPDIFAAGDVTGGPGYVYVAALQGRVAAEAALAGRTGEAPSPIDLTATPRVTFTDPQVASVGMTETEARDAGFRPKATMLPAKHLARAVVSHRPDGTFKLVADAATDRLLGVHVVSANAGDVIGEAVLAIKFGLAAQDLVATLHPYLTWGEGMKLAAQTFTSDVSTLSCCA